MRLLAEKEANLRKNPKSEDRQFASHPDEEHIIVFHVLFLVMCRYLANKLPDMKGFCFLRKLRAEILVDVLNPKCFFADITTSNRDYDKLIPSPSA